MLKLEDNIIWNVSLFSSGLRYLHSFVGFLCGVFIFISDEFLAASFFTYHWCQWFIKVLAYAYYQVPTIYWKVCSICLSNFKLNLNSILLIFSSIYWNCNILLWTYFHSMFFIGGSECFSLRSLSFFECCFRGHYYNNRSRWGLSLEIF